MTSMTYRIFLIRHGATPGNLEGRYIGRTDETLSAAGREDILRHQYPPVDLVFSSPMRRCRETAALIYPELAGFAEPDARHPLHIIEEFRETDFGAFEGKNHRELAGNEDYQTWIDSMGELPFPGGESRAEVKSRVVRGFRRMMEDAEQCICDFGEHIIATDKDCCMDGGTAADVIGEEYCDNDEEHRDNCSGLPADKEKNEKRDTTNGDATSIALIAHGGTLMTLLQELFGGNYFDYMMKNGEGYSFEISHDGICSGLRARSYHRRSGELAASGSLDWKPDCKTYESIPE
jgi:broad specificity phosphatase PhoE